MVVASIGIHQYDTLYVALSCLFYSIRNSFFFFFVCKNEINIPLFFFDFDEICFFFEDCDENIIQYQKSALQP